MDIQAFYAATREAINLPGYDDWLVGYAGPRPTLEQPTDETLQALTEAVILYEEAVAAIPAEFAKLDELSSRINYLYDPVYAAQPGDANARDPADPAIVRWRYETSIENLIKVRGTLTAQAGIIQALLSTYTAARAKVEHDLGWQAYVRDQFGVDPASIEREIKLLVLEPETCC